MGPSAASGWAQRSRWPVANMALCFAGFLVYMTYVNAVFQAGIGSARRLELRVPAAIATAAMFVSAAWQWRNGPAPLDPPADWRPGWLNALAQVVAAPAAMWLDVVRIAACRHIDGLAVLFRNRFIPAGQG